ILVDRHRDAAEAHRRKLREIEARPVFADDRQLVALPEAAVGEPEREVAHLLPIPAPTVGLPDAEILLAQRGTLGSLFGMPPQQLRQRQVGVEAAGFRAARVHAAWPLRSDEPWSPA